MPVPHIPEEAFLHALNRVGTLLDVITPGAETEEVQTATNNFYVARGLDGEYDTRALSLSSAVLAHLRNIDVDDVPSDDVSVVVLGIMLGLLLAQGTGWEPTIPRSGQSHD